MNDEHFAIVVGLSSYPNVPGPPPADLRGPANDAKAVAEWLKDANGGALPPDNVKLYLSETFGAPPNGAPAPNDLNAAMRWLYGLATGRATRKVGKRLYLYFSGHGFAPSQQVACLVTGNAFESQFNDANVTPTAWLDWLLDAGFFREYVLWMDCCMDRLTRQIPAPPPFDYEGGTGGGSPPLRCVIFAAPRRQRAVELPLADAAGKIAYRGVFTRNLIEGLRGAARDKNGEVTGASLFDWLRAAQPGWLDAENARNPIVAKEPQKHTLDEGIVLARDVERPRYAVTLRPPGASEIAIRLWSGRERAAVPRTLTVPPEGKTLQLEPGLYLADGAGLRQGFVVTRPLDLVLNDTGTPAKAVPGQFTLRVAPGDPSDQVFLYDADFGYVSETNSLADGLKLPRGLYLLRQWTGLQLGEKVLMLDADWPAVSSASSKRAALPPSPPIVSAAPLRDTRAAPEYHEEPAGVSAPDVAAGEGAEILVMARRYSDGASAASRAPWDGVALVDSTGTVIADLATQGRRSGAYDAWAACLVRLTPGTYELHYPLGDGTPVAQALIAPKGGWRLEAYLLDRAQDDDVAPARSLLMRPIGTAWGGPDDLWLQKAIISLGAERPGVSEPLAERLLGPAASSLARLVGAHLLLLSARSAPDGAKLLARFDEAVASLQGLLGEAHPDVVALASACADPALRKDGPATTPPMFERSWRLLVDAAQRGRPDLIPPDLWMRVRVTMALPPYFAWSADNSLQKNWHVAAREKLFAPAISTISGLESKAVWRGSANAINRRLRFLDFPPAALAEFKR